MKIQPKRIKLRFIDRGFIRLWLAVMLTQKKQKPGGHPVSVATGQVFMLRSNHGDEPFQIQL
jgi:hypothetical protein